MTVAGNPVLSTPNGAKLDQALANLEFMVSVDPYVNETTRHAHVILPPAIGLEVDHYDVIFHHFGVRNTARASSTRVNATSGSAANAPPSTTRSRTVTTRGASRGSSRAR